MKPFQRDSKSDIKKDKRATNLVTSYPFMNVCNNNNMVECFNATKSHHSSFWTCLSVLCKSVLYFNSIDASNYTDRLMRFVNDSPSKYANCRVKTVVVNERPHLALFATKNILPGTEIRYNYGTASLPWRKVTITLSIFFSSVFLHIHDNNSWRTCDGRGRQWRFHRFAL